MSKGGIHASKQHNAGDCDKGMSERSIQSKLHASLSTERLVTKLLLRIVFSIFHLQFALLIEKFLLLKIYLFNIDEQYQVEVRPFILLFISSE